MITFEATGGNEFHVLVDNKRFGVISPDRGTFYTSPASVQQFVEVSAADLKTIAQKITSSKEEHERATPRRVRVNCC